MKELEKDMAMLRNGMKEVGREIEFYRTQPPVTGDRYVWRWWCIELYGFHHELIWKKNFLTTFRYLPVMKEFTGTASVRLAELEDLFVDMKARVC